ncbi:hypothetical protein [Stackebrandtia soli]|uniref:hypothetical protein n=1 Tax=Stackebrandtia soli TaxID=1892856 RepID=UPI0039EC9788
MSDMRQSLLWSIRHRRGPATIIVGASATLSAIGVGYIVAVDEFAWWIAAIAVAATLVVTRVRRRHVDAVSRELAGLATDPPPRRRPRVI